jgi:hypothetical protein
LILARACKGALTQPEAVTPPLHRLRVNSLWDFAKLATQSLRFGDTCGLQSLEESECSPRLGDVTALTLELTNNFALTFDLALSFHKTCQRKSKFLFNPRSIHLKTTSEVA